MADVFISYKNTPERRLLVRRLALVLHVNGASVWWDNSLGAGQKFKSEIAEEIAKASVVVPLWCAKSIYSDWVNWEAELGRPKLTPAKLQRISPPSAFNEIHAADLVGWDGDIRDSKVETFVQLLCNRLGERKRPTSDLLDDLSQLPKLVALPPEDAELSSFLRQIREAYVRRDAGYPDLDGAMALTLDTELSELLGETPTAEARFAELFDFLADGSSEDLICDEGGNLLIAANDLNEVFTIGQLAHLIARKESEAEIGDDDEINYDNYDDGL